MVPFAGGSYFGIGNTMAAQPNMLQPAINQVSLEQQLIMAQARLAALQYILGQRAIKPEMKREANLGDDDVIDLTRDNEDSGEFDPAIHSTIIKKDDEQGQN